ncbi:anti-sigma factor RsbA family regulatory protein [Amycolatopsis suaedae]|uniref:anti-sigma factor RsbA family regulatory protein n=1 Tax=Amycolatopsis suaedae TaxID=2510978 RepID=UPI003B830BBC
MAPVPSRFEHRALLYADDRDYVAGAVPFVLDGLDAGTPVAVAVPGSRLKLLRTALERSAEAVTWIDLAEVGANPGRILPEVLLAFADANPGPVRIVDETVWPGRTDLEYPACAQHEALVNTAFAGLPAAILCLYDTAGLPREWIAESAATHPELTAGGRRWGSDRYAPDAVVAGHNGPLAEPGGPVVLDTGFGEDGLVTTRRAAAAVGGELGLSVDRGADLQLIADELCTNSVRHGGGRGRLRMWADGDLVACEVTDAGTMTDPLAGRVPVPATNPGGRGLLMVHWLADLVRTRTAPGDNVVRVYLRRQFAP